jgi:heat shock protein HslJ
VESDSPVDGTWVIVGYLSDNEMIVPGVEAIISVDGKLISGTLGVNRFVGEVGDDGVPVGPVATSRMAGPPEAMLQEDLLLRHLDDADSVDVTNEEMRLSGDGVDLVHLRRRGTEEPA